MNSQEFTDERVFQRSRLIRNPMLRVSRTRGLSPDPFGSLPYRAEGCLDHAVAAGAEIFRFTAAFLRGLRSFSSSDVTIHSPESLARFYLAAGRIRQGHRLSPQLLDHRFPFSYEGGKRMGPMFSGYAWRIGSSAVMITHGSSMTSPGLTPGFPSSPLFVLVYQWEAGFLQGATLSPGYLSIAGDLIRQDRHSLVYEAARSLLRGTSMKFAGPVSRMFLFQGFPHRPFS